MTTRRKTGRRSLRGGLVVLVVLALSSCTGSDGSDGADAGRLDERTGRGAPAEPAPPPGRRVGSADARATAGATTEGPQPGTDPTTAATPPAGTADDHPAATFSLSGGADTIRVRVADLGDDLARVTTARGSRVRVDVKVDGSTVLARLVGSGQRGSATVDVTLDSGRRWSIRVSGGASTESLDLSGGRVSWIDLGGGASRIDVVLPRPEGTVTVRTAAGVHRLTVLRDGSAPVQVRIGGGAGTVTVDGATRTGVSAGTVLEQRGYADATDRIEVESAAGVSTLTVGRR
ncbi:hypothetical protein [Plantactinospora sp. KBS50]|uniref:hypothetical protein n=1 Tax=Plantactinospora sp. KBS50 TaxID=2024580 RepID=UPI0012FE3F9C|nr:hypothetical protein [Plantactinospora sp. KBS50]